MAFDPAIEFVKAMNKFRDKRGVGGSFGATTFPRTTWGDVLLMGSSFIQYADPDPSSSACRKSFTALAECQQRRDFTRTSQYSAARAEFKRWQPIEVATRARGLAGGIVFMNQQVQAGAVYPHNFQFWSSGYQFALMRGAAKFVQSPFEIGVEAVSESIKELPATLKKVAEAAIDAAKKGLGFLDKVLEIVKWGSIAGALYLLYEHVLKPNPKAR